MRTLEVCNRVPQHPDLYALTLLLLLLAAVVLLGLSAFYLLLLDQQFRQQVYNLSVPPQLTHHHLIFG